MEGIAAKVCDIVAERGAKFDPPKVEDRIIPGTLNFITSVWSSIKEIPAGLSLWPRLGGWDYFGPIYFGG
jgi:hypothetical protein